MSYYGLQSNNNLNKSLELNHTPHQTSAQLPPEISHTNLVENVILKMGELMLSRKTNTHLENYFYHF